MANKKIEQLYKVSRPCLDDHQFKLEELESVGELSEVCSQIVLKCLYVARIGRLDILWSMNKLARSVTKWIQSCDKRLARLISNIYHTSDYHQYCKYSQLHMSVRHDHEHERTERKTSRLQPTHTTRVGALPQSLPGLGTLVGPGKDTHGTPVPRRKAVGGRTSSTIRRPTNDNTTKTSLKTNVLSAKPGVDTLGNLQILSCGKHGTARQTGFVPRLRLCWRH